MRLIAAILLAAILTGCTSTRPWEGAQIGCLQYANAACIAAINDGHLSGVIECTLPNTTQRHAVTWIIEDGVTLYYDRAFRIYRTELGVTHRTTDGPSRGSFEIIPATKMYGSQ